MTLNEKPLVLSEELKKLVRQNDPSLWLRDAQSEISNWASNLPAAKRVKFEANFRDERVLDLKVEDGFGDTAIAGRYSVRGNKVVFRRSARPEEDLHSEQLLLKHLLAELSRLIFET